MTARAVFPLMACLFFYGLSMDGILYWVTINTYLLHYIICFATIELLQVSRFFTSLC